MDEAHANSKGFREIQALSPDWIPDFDSLYNFPPASRMTMAAKLRLSRAGLEGVSLLPAWVGPDAQPEFLRADDPRFGEVAAYLEKISRDAGLTTRFTPEGDELLVAP
jgi:poly-gamma-glutamate synthesis protein (capsule biosynthesis protein)